VDRQALVAGATGRGKTNTVCEYLTTMCSNTAPVTF
jgi:Flp pilus assembly CpaF family ATPase